MDNRVVALYIRLSVEDIKTDSLSVENQSKLLHRHLDSLPEFANCEIREFIDNGHTGTNFERPAMTELLDMVRENKIACILVKDFSRFGRSMLDMGYFIEKVFPLFGTRFIAVSDVFDSAGYKDDTGGIDVTFKYLISEYYSKDLSVKSKEARHTKMKRGEYVSTNTFYGYKLNKDRQMVIDEDVADNVRLIFQLALEGKSSNEIKGELYNRKVLTPAEYKASKGKNHYDISRTNKIWSQSMILRILYDERYTGVYIMGKSEVKSVGSRGVKKKDESLWYKVPDALPVIIDKDTFDKVNGQLLRFKCPKKKKINHTLLSKIICGSCGHVMNRVPKKEPFFECRFTHHIEDFPCFGLTLSQKDLEEIIFQVMSKQAEVILGLSDLTDLSQLDTLLQEKNTFELQMDELHKQKRGLYEKLVAETISVEQYKTEKSAIDTKLVNLNLTYSAVSSQTDQMQRSADQKENRLETAKVIQEEQSLTKKLVDLLIEKVLVYPNEQIEIVWKFNDFMK